MDTQNINSFSENLRRTITAQTNTLNLLESIQESITSNDTFVAYDYTKLKNGETITYQLPSYTATINRLKAVENNIQNLTAGKATINLTDGSRRQIKLTNLPQVPNKINGIISPTTFSIDSNWFFEDLMFPGCTVNIDLTGKIDDTSDRVKMKRIILDAQDQNTQSIWKNILESNDFDYIELLNQLTNNNILYSEDEQIIELPLTTNTLSGTFQIIDDPEIINGNTWYKLDTLQYNTINANGEIIGNNNILSVGDQLAYNNTLYSIIEVDQNNSKVRIKLLNGVAIPGVYSIFTYYQDPFRKKEIKVRFGAHEYNIIYIKGVNEDFNLLANEWSTPIKFVSDDLVLDVDNNQKFSQFYFNSVVDWGAQWIAESKERKISAYFGHIPNAPTLRENDLRVVQINTQINAALAQADITNTASEIESTRSQIIQMKQTIAAQKTELQNITTTAEYNTMQEQIATNTTELQNLQASYSTLVSNFQSAVTENNAVTENPKYHIRGFFAIPRFKYRDNDETIPEQIIGFEIAYRYICEDNTGTQLNTFSYTDNDGSSIISGTFTDWIVQQGQIKQRIYNSSTKMFEWKSENVADGSEININQIDIAISKGEKVEIKARSISEAGYPENPLKSEWSNTITVSFPSNLSTTNAIADLIKEINDDALNVAIDTHLSSLGLTTHMADTIPNTNSVNGLYFNHTANLIAYEDKSSDGLTVNTISAQEKIEALEKRINTLENFITNQLEILKK